MSYETFPLSSEKAWQEDPDASVFWFNQWLARFDASFSGETPIFAQLVSESVQKELEITNGKAQVQVPLPFDPDR